MARLTALGRTFDAAYKKKTAESLVRETHTVTEGSLRIKSTLAWWGPQLSLHGNATLHFSALPPLHTSSTAAVPNLSGLTDHLPL